MKYFQIKNDMQIGGSWLLGDLLDATGQEVHRWDFRRGIAVERHDVCSVGLVKEGYPLDLNFNIWNTLIVSEKAKSVLQSLASDSVQFCDVTVPSVKAPYFIANISKLVDCLDESLSHVERFAVNDPVRPDRAEEISLVLDLHVDVNRTMGRHLFRIDGYDGAVIVSADLRRALEGARLSGSKFDDVSSPEIADYRIKFAERQRNRALNG